MKKIYRENSDISLCESHSIYNKNETKNKIRLSNLI